MARDVTGALIDAGLPVAVVDVDPEFGRWRHDLSFQKYEAKSVDDLAYPVNLFVLSPPTLATFLVQHPALVSSGEFLNVAQIMWELSVVPPVIKRTIELCD